MPDHSSHDDLLADALAKIRALKRRVSELEQSRNEPVAIVGAGLRFPGGVENLDSFWNSLAAGSDTVREVPHDRLDIESHFDPNPEAVGKTYTRWGSFLDRIDRFDAEFFGISPLEAKTLDPQQRLLLELSWKAFEDAAICPADIRESDTGVFIGLMYQEYSMAMLADGGLSGIDAYFGTGTTHSATVGRLSHFYGLHGPSIAVDTACSSSLVSIHLACESLRRGDSALVLAGGVNLFSSVAPTINLSRARMMSPTGRCRTFDAAADGYVRGEGGALVVMKLLSRAIEDGDRIHGIIRGSAVNHAGQTNGLTAPSGVAQHSLITTALHNAGCAPADIDYIECHGTGTPLGDPIEVNALAKVFGSGGPRKKPLLLGSVKTNFGHLEGAAGICGLLKALLVLKHRQVPPNLHLETPNPHLRLKGSSIELPRDLSDLPLKHDSGPRFSGVSAFGFVGTNAHVVMESPALMTDSVARASLRPVNLLAISAGNETSLRELALAHGRALAEKITDDQFADYCFSVNAFRQSFGNRLFVNASDREGAAKALCAIAESKVLPFDRCAQVALEQDPSPVFLFSGQGAQFAGMGKVLWQTSPVFRRSIERCAGIVDPLLDVSLVSLVTGSQSPQLAETRYAQPALFAFEVALVELLRSWGIRPRAVIGHSLGEYVAACVAGVFSLEDGLRLVVRRGELMATLAPGEMLVATGEPDQMAEFAERYGVSLAAINGEKEVALSGEADAIARVAHELREQNITVKALGSEKAYHSPAVIPVMDAFKASLDAVEFREARIPVFSNLTGKPVQMDAAYWIAQARATVKFFPAVVAAVNEIPDPVLLEIGPLPVLLPALKRSTKLNAVSCFPTHRKGHMAWKSLLKTTGALFLRGYSIDWKGFDRPYSPRRVDTPHYTFDRKSYWYTDRELKTQGSGPLAVVKSAESSISSEPSLPKFSIMFFAARNEHCEQGTSPYQFVIDAARFADRNGFHAVWVPERHFTAMGSLYPNPSVLHSALARETSQLRLCAGSVVAPLHHPVRIAEEWAMVDQLSNGRVGVSLASGWNPADFALFPSDYDNRKQILEQRVDQVRSLWRGEPIQITDGTGQLQDVIPFPSPVQKELPMWITAASNPATFQLAGTLGVNLLTHLLDQDVEELSEKIALYRRALTENGHDAATHQVTIMVHAYVGADFDRVIEEVRDPFCEYLKNNKGLLAGLARSRGRDTDVSSISDRDMDAFTNFLFERFHQTRALIGTPETCAPLVKQLQEAGVDEIAALLDFGPDSQLILDNLSHLATLRAKFVSRMDDAETPGKQAIATASAVSEGVEYQIEWLPVEIPKRTETASRGRWIVFADRTGLGSALKVQLEQAGYAVTLVYRSDSEISIDQCDDIAGAVYLWALDCPVIVPGEYNEDAIQEGRLLAGTLPLAAVRQLAGLPSHDIWFVTRAAVAAGGAQVEALTQSLLWGGARVVSVEYPLHRGRLLDLDSGDLTEQATAIHGLITNRSNEEDRLALRNGEWYAERLQRASTVPLTTGFSASREGSYLVTGGLGGIGWETAKFLLHRGAGAIVLVSRRPIPPREQWSDLPGDDSLSHVLAEVLSLQAEGKRIEFLTADVTQRDALAAAMANLYESGDLPSLRGVVHAAGIWDDVSLDTMTVEQYEQVVRPKLEGTLALAFVLKDQPLDFFYMTSSFSSVAPAHGQGSYAAANAFLDAFAHAGKALFPTMSVNWGPWSEVGFASSADGSRAHDRLAGFGLRRFSPAEGIALTNEILTRMPTQPVLFSVDWELLAAADPRLAGSPLLYEILGSRQHSIAADVSQNIAAELAAIPGEELDATMLERVVGMVCGIMERETKSTFPVGKPLIQLGLDSLMAVDLKNEILRTTGIDFPLVRFLEGTTAADVAVEIGNQVRLAKLRPDTGVESSKEQVMEEFSI